jgi:hypothetical protein
MCHVQKVLHRTIEFWFWLLKNQIERGFDLIFETDFKTGI